MSQELVRVETVDGLYLDGWLVCTSAEYSSGSNSEALQQAACLLVHGTGSHFYAGGVLQTLANSAHTAGFSTLRINTRGHDGICHIPRRQGSILGGATYERVSDSIHDLKAWIQFLEELGYSRIVLIGHSMGGIKCALTLSQQCPPAIAGLVLLASPRFHHETFWQDPQGSGFREAYELAQGFVEQGRPDELISMTQPLSLLLTAKGVLDKYGPENRYDLAALIKKIDVPMLYVVPGLAPRQSIGFSAIPDLLQDLNVIKPNLAVCTIDDANVSFSGKETLVSEQIVNWMRSPGNLTV